MEPSPRPTVLYEVTNGGRLVIEYWSGHVERHDIEVHSKSHLSNPEVVLRAATIVDARSADFAIDLKDVADIVDCLFANYVDKLNIGKCAVLVNDKTYEMARSYERSAEKYGINVIVFSDLAIACTWLGIDMAIVSQSLERMRTARLTR